MQLIFANPAGLWALLGIPAVLLIHLIQQRTRRVNTSTLFLLPEMAAQSTYARSIDRIRSSWNLWLQLLATILIALLLSEPTTIKDGSTQRVLVVLDSSLSIGAFLDSLRSELSEKLSELSKKAEKTEWIIFDSAPGNEILYSGPDLHKLNEKIASWRPRFGTHDFAPALESAQRKAGPDGVVLFVTDREIEVPLSVAVLGIGEPILNVGFAGMQVIREKNEFTYQLLVRNYSSQPLVRNWWIESNGKKSKESSLELPANGIVTLRGKFPAPLESIVVAMESDSFPVDDRVPIVIPKRKALSVWIDADAPFTPFAIRMLTGMEAAERIGSRANADIAWGVSDGGTEGRNGEIIFASAPGNSKRSGIPVAEAGSIASGLDWGGLLASPLSGNWAADDSVLVWQGGTPLIVERRSPGGSALIVNFYLPHSNATRHAGFILLLNRFIESVRARKVALEHANFELNQPLNISADLFGPEISFRSIDLTSGDLIHSSATARQAAFLRSLPFPATFKVFQGEQLLLEGAAHFADTREAEFRSASTFYITAKRDVDSTKIRSEESLFDPLWILALLCIMTLNWYLPRRTTRKVVA